MASPTHTIKLSPSLADAIEIRAKAIGYTSRNAYIKGLIRYDLMVQGGHSVTLPISHRRLNEQDRIDDEMLELTKTGKGVRGEWLEFAIQRAVAKAATDIPGQIGEDLADD